ncbi:TPA: hypothetical protein DCR85_03095 [Candidatus Moranbacteria bacterium]|nr:hypothetical protein [Candidatus Moranbacteria bacterium]
MQSRRYPKLFIRSKNELAKHISHENFPKEKALVLINDVIANFDFYWKDSVHSDPLKEKFIRNAKHTKLGLLLRKLNTLVLAPHDKLLPKFIYGGVKEMSHAKAAKNLLGSKRKRILLKMDLKKFFEQVSSERVAYFFQNKCECSKKTSEMLSCLCCVPIGPKNNGASKKAIARGFSTSPRLAAWCNLDIFIKLERLIQKRLSGHDPKISVYVDDIGITASRLPREVMEKLRDEVSSFLLTADSKQQLEINQDKTIITSHEEGMEYVGARLYRNKLGLGKKAKSKRDQTKNKLKKNSDPKVRESLRRKLNGMNHHKKYIETT